MKIKARKVENGFIVSYGKKEFFCKDEDEGRNKVRELFMAEVAPVMAQLEVERLFPLVLESV